MSESISQPVGTSGPLPERITRIILTGFMGAGKSTVGALLTQRLGWSFSDSDRFIEARAGATISEIFRRDGEAVFRRLEAEAIEELAQQESIVLALGGGAVETASTREILRRLPHTCIVFLEAPLEVLVSRCADQPDAAVRPVLADRERLEQRLAARLPLYREAHLTVLTGDIPPEGVADHILRQLHDRTETMMKESTSA
jgi:shikimate kinase